MAKGGLGISHLLFTNDILLFGGAKVSEMRIIMKVLKDSEDVSNLVECGKIQGYGVEEC